MTLLFRPSGLHSKFRAMNVSVFFFLQHISAYLTVKESVGSLAKHYILRR